jgi:cyclic pyranopterin monophosphate synthase
VSEGKLTHLDADGRPRMVDVSAKPRTARRAVAAGCLTLDEACAAALEAEAGLQKKGDPWSVARIGAITAAKRTADLIPLTHPLTLDAIHVDHLWDAAHRRAWFRAEVLLEGRTGVEMEALTAVTGALLTLYDMLKAAGHGMELGPVRLLLKSGGRHGTVSHPWPDCPWSA